MYHGYSRTLIIRTLGEEWYYVVQGKPLNWEMGKWDILLIGRRINGIFG